LRVAVTELLARDLHDAVIPGFAWDLGANIWTDRTDWIHHVKQLPGDYRCTPAEQ